MRTERTAFNNGLPFNNDLKVNLDDLKKRVLEDNKAAMIIIDGQVGEGKTTLAVQCADYMNGGPISFDIQLGMGGEQFIKKLHATYENKRHVVIYDEAGDFNKRGSISRFNAMMGRIFETYRAFKVVVICTLPSFHDLDSQLLDKGIPRLLLHVYDRRKIYGNFKGYNTYRMNYIKHKMGKMIVKAKAYTYTTPNFYGRFKDLEKSRRLELEKINIKGKLDIVQNAENKQKGLMSIKDMAEVTGMASVTVNAKLRKMGIKPVEVIGRKQLFRSELVGRLKLEKNGRKPRT